MAEHKIPIDEQEEMERPGTMSLRSLFAEVGFDGKNFLRLPLHLRSGNAADPTLHAHLEQYFRLRSNVAFEAGGPTDDTSVTSQSCYTAGSFEKLLSTAFNLGAAYGLADSAKFARASLRFVREFGIDVDTWSRIPTCSRTASGVLWDCRDGVVTSVTYNDKYEISYHWLPWPHVKIVIKRQRKIETLPVEAVLRTIRAAFARDTALNVFSE